MLTVGVTFVGTVVANPASFDSDPAAVVASGACRPLSGLEITWLTLAELEAAPRALLSVLLALLDAGVAGQEPRLLEPLAQLEVELAQGLGDPVAQRAGLGRGAAPVQVRGDVELLDRLRGREGLAGEHLQGLVAAEVVLHGLVVQLDLAGAGPQVHAGHRRLPLSGRVVVSRLRAQRFSFVSFTGWGFWA